MTYDFPTHINGSFWKPKSFKVDINGTLLDLTGLAIEFMVKDCKGNAVETSTVGSGVTLTDPTNGEFAIDGKTLSLPEGVYHYCITITLSGSRPMKWIRGLLTTKDC